ncbi:uncharacterized protein SCDLUD_000006 [Saccharomycodes ludwigii]|uniref:uncharacterized protein n=1 Tax=Saccharomycodes ludwigii TaxID=36035 RepID=UPI001E8A625D|nr:hypothetical protein SCDLUD_000006 [Saccharomycodes ludwigii]KAH3902429.1 hypothetical protein SCDLUD_000006 [Saccharomycodes ludwigii]
MRKLVTNPINKVPSMYIWLGGPYNKMYILYKFYTVISWAVGNGIPGILIYTLKLAKANDFCVRGKLYRVIKYWTTIDFRGVSILAK